MAKNTAIARIAMVAVVLGLAFLTGGSAGAQAIDPPAPETPASDLQAVTGQISSNTFGLFLVNPRTGRLAVYEYVPAERKLRLLAARDIAADLQLAPPAASQPAPPARQAETPLFGVAGNLTPDTFGLFLVDGAQPSVAVYEYVPGQRRLDLRAARNVAYDLHLESYNTDPLPKDVADLVRRAQTLPEPTAQPQ